MEQLHMTATSDPSDDESLMLLAGELAVLRARLTTIEAAVGQPVPRWAPAPPTLPALARRVAALERQAGIVPGLVPLTGTPAAPSARPAITATCPRERGQVWRNRAQALLAAALLLAVFTWLLRPTVRRENATQPTMTTASAPTAQAISAPPTASTQACATLASERCAGNEDHLATPVALTGEPPCFLSDALSCGVSGAENDITATAPGATWTVEFVATPPPCAWEAPAPTCAPAFAPARLVIQAGDTVVWQVTGGLHTVTFPAAGTSAPPLYLPSASAAGTLNSLVAAPRGGMVYDGTVLVGSGLLDERTPVYQLTFPQPGHYVYADLEHPGLAGEVIVLPAAGKAGPLP